MNLLRTHQKLYERTDGRLGHRMLGVPVLLLRTTGQRSGQTRTNGLTYARDGDAWLVVASNGGSDKAPGWLHNLRADPTAEIQVARRRTPVVATILTPDDADYTRVWDIVNAGNRDRYRAYATKTQRPIPVVVLRKADPGA
jgi:deazaflavin-dependent oxidoreductase (nitroreductase family)